MVRKQFLKTSLLSSLLFFILSNIIDFLVTREIHDLFSYVILLVLSIFVFGPMIAVLVEDYQNTHHKKDYNVEI